MSNWAEGWTRGGWVSRDERPREARQVHRTANSAKRRLRNLNRKIDNVRENKHMSGARKEREIISLYQERTAIFERAVIRMRDPYNRWQREN